MRADWKGLYGMHVLYSIKIFETIFNPFGQSVSIMDTFLYSFFRHFFFFLRL